MIGELNIDRTREKIELMYEILEWMDGGTRNRRGGVQTRRH